MFCILSACFFELKIKFSRYSRYRINEKQNCDFLQPVLSPKAAFYALSECGRTGRRNTGGSSGEFISSLFFPPCRPLCPSMLKARPSCSIILVKWVVFSCSCHFHSNEPYFYCSRETAFPIERQLRIKIMSASVKRGYFPDDRHNFTGSALETLHRAAGELYFLLNRGYPAKSASAFIGNHYLLPERGRGALTRAVASEKDIAARKAKQLRQVPKNETVHIDGFNEIITLEVALSG